MHGQRSARSPHVDVPGRSLALVAATGPKCVEASTAPLPADPERSSRARLRSSSRRAGPTIFPSLASAGPVAPLVPSRFAPAPGPCAAGIQHHEVPTVGKDAPHVDRRADTL